MYSCINSELFIMSINIIKYIEYIMFKLLTTNCYNEFIQTELGFKLVLMPHPLEIGIECTNCFRLVRTIKICQLVF